MAKAIAKVAMGTHNINTILRASTYTLKTWSLSSAKKKRKFEIKIIPDELLVIGLLEYYC